MTRFEKINNVLLEFTDYAIECEDGHIVKRVPEMSLNYIRFTNEQMREKLRLVQCA